jgi:hypothetical protein
MDLWLADDSANSKAGYEEFSSAKRHIVKDSNLYQFM